MSARKPTKPSNILSEALHLVKENRAAEHGLFDKNCRDAATIAAAMGVHINPADVPVVLLALKFARMRQNPASVDNYVDAAGYLQLLAEVRGVEVQSPAAG